MKALVLAAGLGERLRPLTNVTPKPLLEVGGRPLIHCVLGLLQRSGIDQVAINVHHLADRIESALGDGRALGLKITYSPNRSCWVPARRWLYSGSFSMARPSW